MGTNLHVTEWGKCVYEAIRGEGDAEKKHVILHGCAHCNMILMNTNPVVMFPLAAKLARDLSKGQVAESETRPS